MAIFDLVFAIALLIAAVIGLMKGLVRQLFGLIGLFLGIFLAYRLAAKISAWWSAQFSVDPLAAKVITFIILLIIVSVLVIWLAKLVDKLINFTMLGWINRLCGMVLGIVQIVLIFAAGAYAINSLNLTEISGLRKDIEKSVTYKPLVGTAKFLLPYIKFDKFKAMEQSIDRSINNVI